MLDQKIKARPGFPVAALLFLLLALGLIALTFVHRTLDWTIGAVLPLGLAAALFLARNKPFHATFTQTALEVEDPPRSIPYTELQGLIAVGRPQNPFKTGPRHYPIQIVHTEGSLWVPARLNVPSDEVYLFLYKHLSVKGGTSVNPKLADYLNRKVREFGPDRVWSYCARQHRGTVRNTRRAQAFCLGVVVAGLIWLVRGIQTGPGNSPWFGLGIGCLVFGFLFWLIFWLIRYQGGRIPHWKQASLIVSPDGLALIQGDLRGQLRWDEMLDVKLLKQVGIHIKVPGALIAIADIYDRPLILIYQQICYYWRGEPTNEEAERVWKHAEEAAREERRGDPHVTEG